jgi:hypothetical protein
MSIRGLKPDCGRSVIPDVMEYNKSLGGFKRVEIVCPFWGWPKGTSSFESLQDLAEPRQILSYERLGKRQPQVRY